MTSIDVRCDTQHTFTVPKSLKDTCPVDIGAFFGLSATGPDKGKGHFRCVGDTVRESAILSSHSAMVHWWNDSIPSVLVDGKRSASLAVGDSLQVAELECTRTAQTTVTCRDRSTNHGFSVDPNAPTYYLF